MFLGILVLIALIQASSATAHAHSHTKHGSHAVKTTHKNTLFITPLHSEIEPVEEGKSSSSSASFNDSGPGCQQKLENCAYCPQNFECQRCFVKYYKENKGCARCNETCLDCTSADRCSSCPSIMTVDLQGECSYLMTLWIILVVLGILGICGCALILSAPKAIQVIKDKSKNSSALEQDIDLGSTLIDGSDVGEEDRVFGESVGLSRDSSEGGGLGHAIAKPNAKSGKVAPGKFYQI